MKEFLLDVAGVFSASPAQTGKRQIVSKEYNAFHSASISIRVRKKTIEHSARKGGFKMLTNAAFPEKNKKKTAAYLAAALASSARLQACACCFRMTAYADRSFIACSVSPASLNTPLVRHYTSLSNKWGAVYLRFLILSLYQKKTQPTVCFTRSCSSARLALLKRSSVPTR